MCSDMFAHAEFVHPLFCGTEHDKAPPARWCVGFVTTPLQVCGCMAKVSIFSSVSGRNVFSYYCLDGCLDLPSAAGSNNLCSSSIIEISQCFRLLAFSLFGIRMLVVLLSQTYLHSVPVLENGLAVILLFVFL